MPKVNQVELDGAPVKGAFEKVSTEGDMFRVAGAETGKSEVVSMADTSGKVVWGGAYADVTLGFPYLMGVHQVQVGKVDPTTGHVAPLLDLAVVNEARARDGSEIPSTMDPAANASFLCFEELSPEAVRVYNAGATDVLWFGVPHTSTPAAVSSRVSVQRQGDNVAVEALGDGDGIALRAPNGRRGLVRLENNLKLNVVPR